MSAEKGSLQEKEGLMQQQPPTQTGYGAPPAGYGAPQYAHPQGYPPAGYAQPPAGYGPPPAGYGQPPAGYGQPPAGYGQPPAGYAQPPPGYGQPPQQYAAPPPGQGYAPQPQVYPPPQPVVHQPTTQAQPQQGPYQLPQQQQPIQMQADPSKPGMWSSVMTQDGNLGVTVPAPPAYTPPQGPWYTAPMTTVVLPQALTGPPDKYYNLSESWDEYLVRGRNKMTICLAICSIVCLCNCILGPIGIFFAHKSNGHMDKKEGKEANKKSLIAIGLVLTWIVLAFIILPVSAIVHAKVTKGD